MYADMHIHTYFSDSTLTPEAAAEQCRDADISVAAVADHNTWEAFPRFYEACRKLGIKALRACEFDCQYSGLQLHILGYNFSPSPQLKEIAERSRRLLLLMSSDLVEKMQPTYPHLSREKCDAFTYDRLKGGWAGLHYLVEEGIISRPEEGMPLYSAYGCDYIDYPFPDCREVIDAIRGCGGYPVLAHPCNWFSGLTRSELYAHLDALTAMGLAGIECHYTANSPEITRMCVDYCRAHDLLITEGSDSHGIFHRMSRGFDFSIGAVRVPVSELNLAPLLK